MTAGGRGAFGKVSSARDKNLQTGRKSHPMTFKPFALACAAIALVPAAMAGSVLRPGQTTAQFQQMWDTFFSKPGKRLVSFDGFQAPSGMTYVVYGTEEDHPGVMAYAEMDIASFQERFDEAAKGGMGLTDISVAETPDGAKFGGVWVKGEATASRGNLTQGQLNTWQVNALEQGDIPIDLDCYGTDQDRKYAVIWKHDPSAGGFKMEYGLSRNAFQERYDLHVDEGYRLVQLDVCSNNDSPRYGGIFVKTDGRNWYSRGDLTQAQLLSEQNNADAQGYALLSVSGYVSGSQVRYAAVWSQ